jgi:hypothetical protein
MKTLYFTIMAYGILIIVMIIINEYSRSHQNKKAYKYKGINAILSGEKSQSQCSWVCHNNTLYCKKYHTHHIVDQNQTDLLYFGIINLLKGTGNYGLANVLILVIIVPFFSMAIFIKGVQLKFKNNL